MSYTKFNFKRKKDLKQALKDKEEIHCYNPGIGPDLTRFSGMVSLEGPHFPLLHTWYARGEMVNGCLVKVK